MVTLEKKISAVNGLMTLIFGWQMSTGVISRTTKGFSKLSILVELLFAKKGPKLGIQLPNAGDDNQCCFMLTVLFNRIDQLQFLQYNLYISTLFYTNVSISTSLWVCVQPMYNTPRR